MKALIIGATGATGKELVEELLKDDQYGEIHLFGRSEPALKNPKIVNHLVDFEQPEAWENFVNGDVAFSCLGTTLKAAGSKEGQKKVDYKYQLDFAKAASKNNVDRFILISSYGADATSNLFYNKMKGDLEVEVKKLDFKQTVLFQPGMLDRPDSERFSEVWGVKLIKTLNSFGILKKYRPLKTRELAEAMVKSSKHPMNGLEEIKLDEIVKTT